jgi:biopolymer transport protein ExbD
MSTSADEEPNLTPMLDMVLQLVMFFMMVANFKMEQANPDIQLPTSQSARPPEKTEGTAVLYLNVNKDGALDLKDGYPPRKDPGAIKVYLDGEYKTALDKQASEGDNSGVAKTVVIIRGDMRSNFGAIYNVLQQARAAKFTKWQLRGNIKNSD